MPKRSWASAALAALALVAGCSGGGSDDEEPSLTVYVSLPPAGDGADAADGARIAFDEVGGEVAGTTIRVEFLDAWGSKGRWTPVQAAANARTAIQDSTAIAYLGDFESGATRASLPVTNEARLLQVSPASSAEDLVAVPGTDDVPETQPSGSRSFGRVIPGDVAQAEAGARWAEELGLERIATASDGSSFGDLMVETFEEALTAASLTQRDAELTYYGGLPGAQPPAPRRGRLMVTDAQLVPHVTPLPDETLATAAALAPNQLPPAASGFAREFAAEYGRKPGPYAAYGYEAMALILASIERADEPTDRGSVIDAFFSTTDRDSVLGTYSISELGETTLEAMTGYEFRGGEPRPVARLAG